jgi:hypothetical protein
MVSPEPDEVSRAADQLSRERRPVRLSCSMWAPEDETGIFPFEAPSPEVVGLHWAALLEGEF